MDGEEARVASHEPDDAEASREGARFDDGDVDRALRLGDGRVEAEAPVDERDVVVDRLRDAPGREKGDVFSPFEARISVSFHSFRLIFGREIISR